MTHIAIGPVRMRLSWKGVAPWGYAWLELGGLSVLSRDSGGGINLLSYHPRRHKTWLWYVNIKREPSAVPHRAVRRTGQWHDLYWLPFGWRLSVGHQDWHKRKPDAAID